MATHTGKEFTIGMLAKKARLAPSVLRYYEKEGLLKPTRRTAAGYRLYGPEAVKTLLFVTRAKRLGFSLNDIRKLLSPREEAGIAARITQDRFLEIERRLTNLLVLRHELEVFLLEMSGQLPQSDGARRVYQRLVDRVCGHPSSSRDQSASFPALLKRMGCKLAKLPSKSGLTIFRGLHRHVWREEDGYTVLVPGDEPGIGVALEQIAASEAGCGAHPQPWVEKTPRVTCSAPRGKCVPVRPVFYGAGEQLPRLSQLNGELRPDNGRTTPGCAPVDPANSWELSARDFPWGQITNWVGTSRERKA